jgi:hypothetical protein
MIEDKQSSQFVYTMLLHNGGFCNNCITKWMLYLFSSETQYDYKMTKNMRHLLSYAVFVIKPLQNPPICSITVFQSVQME